MQRYDGEIGRGRRRSSNDSLSSRESSPDQPRQRRAFSPAGSDGGEDPAPSNTQITPPPPQERPLIRQAVAFATDQQPQNIVTYEATPPQIRKGFLPGQQPVFLPKPPRVPKEKTAPKRPRRTDPYTTQTTRFRIDTYDPTPSTEPPIAHGNGPYSSLYRSSAVPLNNVPNAPAETLPPAGRSMGSTRASTSSAPSLNRLPPSETNRTTSHQRQQHHATGSRHIAPPPPSPSLVPPHQQHNRYSHPPPQSPSGPSSGPSHYNPSPYYRNDYDRGVVVPSRRPSPPPLNTPEIRENNHSQSSAVSRAEFSHRGEINDQGPPKPKTPLRMVTLLIQDVRSGTTDHQLAEVRVPLRLADHEGTGFWADARAICEQLQAGPSRIDGPARVYTLRGKYRQFILRVSKDNVDELFSCNIAVQGDRTVDLVVETLLPAGAPPQPPRIPQDLLDAYGHNERNNHSEASDEMYVEEPQPTRKNIGGARKRVSSPSFDDYDGPDSPPPSKKPAHARYPHKSSNNGSSQRPNPSRNQSFDSSSQSQRRRPSPLQRPAYDSRPDDPPIPSSPRPNEALFLKLLQKYVQDHNPSGYRNFFRSTVGNDVSDLLCQYEFFMKAINEFVGKPLGAYEDLIEERHLVKLMKIKDEAFLDECKETMKLLARYGDESLPQYDPRITEMIKRRVDEEHKVQTRREFLQLLREVDRKWKNSPRPEEHRSRNPSEKHSRTPPETRSRNSSEEHSSNPSEAHSRKPSEEHFRNSSEEPEVEAVQETRNSKGMFVD